MPALRNLLDRTARAWQLPLPGLLRSQGHERAQEQGAPGGDAVRHREDQGRTEPGRHPGRGQAKEGAC